MYVSIYNQFGLFKVSDILSPPLAESVRQQFHNEHRKQMIIELIGKQFRRSYLADVSDNPLMLVSGSVFQINIH